MFLNYNFHNLGLMAILTVLSLKLAWASFLSLFSSTKGAQALSPFSELKSPEQSSSADVSGDSILSGRYSRDLNEATWRTDSIGMVRGVPHFRLHI